MKKADLVRLQERYSREWLVADPARETEIVSELGLYSPHEAAFLSAGVMIALRSAARSAETQEAKDNANARMLRWMKLCGEEAEHRDNPSRPDEEREEQGVRSH
jgi:hypothetical protein